MCDFVRSFIRHITLNSSLRSITLLSFNFFLLFHSALFLPFPFSYFACHWLVDEKRLSQNGELIPMLY